MAAIDRRPGRRGAPRRTPAADPKALHNLQELAREHTEAAIDTLAKIMNDEKAPHSARISAADALLSRGWGRPILPTVQTTEKTFSQWIDELDEYSKRTLEEGIARMERGELDECEPSGSA